MSPDLQREDWDSPRASRRGDDAKPDWSPPFGTSQRIRNRAIWAVALVTAAVPPAFVALGIAEVTQDQFNIALPLAVGFSVRDRGSGIPWEPRETVFGPFATSKCQGRGRGGTIWRSVVRSIGGGIGGVP